MPAYPDADELCTFRRDRVKIYEILAESLDTSYWAKKAAEMLRKEAQELARFC